MKKNQKVKMQGANGKERWRDAESKRGAAGFVFRGKANLGLGLGKHAIYTCFLF